MESVNQAQLPIQTSFSLAQALPSSAFSILHAMCTSAHAILALQFFIVTVAIAGRC